MTASSPTLLEIHERHARFVWACLYRMGVRQGDLPDQVQEVFIVVHRRLDSYDRSSKVTSWLYGICHKVAAGYRRRASVRREQLGEKDSAQSGEHPCEITPEDLAAEKSSTKQLQKLLDGLDVDKRAVLVMFEIEELSCQEIAEQIGVPVGTVHSRLHAARKELKKAFERVRARDKRQGAA